MRICYPRSNSKTILLADAVGNSIRSLERRARHAVARKRSTIVRALVKASRTWWPVSRTARSIGIRSRWRSWGFSCTGDFPDAPRFIDLRHLGCKRRPHEPQRYQR